jgi:deoxyribose-phosphate aldolase
MDKIQQLAQMIDHSILHPTATDEDLRKGCEVALQYGTATVCVKPYAVAEAARLLEGSAVGVCTVIGFPHGGAATAIKVAETRLACSEGALEIDMVVNIGKVMAGDWDYVQQEIQAVNDEALLHGGIVKVIFENDYLTDEQKIRLCEICNEVGVAFVKTSTGYGYVKGSDGKFSTKGATIPDLILMRKHSNPEIQVKAAGGIRTLDEMLTAIETGISRVGATATVAILEEAKARFGGGSDYTGNNVPDASGY